MSKKHFRTGLRYLFALIFVATAVGKLLDNRGFADVLSHYRLMLPMNVLLPFALSISMAEFILGILLVYGRHALLLSKITVLINFSYLGLAALTLYRHISIQNCGCFGVFLARPLSGMTLVEDGVLLGLSLLFVWVNWETS